MTDNDYDRAYEAGRAGHGYSGGGSIEYAAWAAGHEMHAKQASGGGGGGGGGAINYKGKVVTVGIMLGMIGMFFGLLSDGTVGAFVGFGIGFVAGALIRMSGTLVWRIGKVLPHLGPLILGLFAGAVYGVGVAVRAGLPREGLMTRYAVAGAVLFVVLYMIWRRVRPAGAVLQLEDDDDDPAPALPPVEVARPAPTAAELRIAARLRRANERWK